MHGARPAVWESHSGPHCPGPARAQGPIATASRWDVQLTASVDSLLARQLRFGNWVFSSDPANAETRTGPRLEEPSPTFYYTCCAHKRCHLTEWSVLPMRQRWACSLVTKIRGAHWLLSWACFTACAKNSHNLSHKPTCGRSVQLKYIPAEKCPTEIYTSCDQLSNQGFGVPWWRSG